MQTTVTTVDWLLDSDASIRWQVMRNLTDDRALGVLRWSVAP